MKILYLTNIPSPYRIDFFNELGKQCDLTVLYELEKAIDRDRKWIGEKAFKYREVFLNGKRIGNDSAICFSIIKFLMKNDYDLIVVGGYSTPTGMLAIEYLKLFKKKFILNSDGGITKNDSYFKYRLKRYFIGSANAWLSTGENTNKYLLKYGAKINNIFQYPFTSVKFDKVSKAPISEVEKKSIRVKLGIKYEKVIISVGQFINRKGFDVLIRAAKNLPDGYGVYIIGGVPTAEYISLKKESNINNIHFEGFKSKFELENYYKSADVFVLPTREDIWGLVINEAMSYGVPFITTNKCVAGLEFVKKGECGKIFNVDNVRELVILIKEMLEDKENLKNMSVNSIDIISKYTIEEMASEHINIFKKLLN